MKVCRLAACKLSGGGAISYLFLFREVLYETLSCILSLLNLNDDQNLIYPDNFLGSADFFVPTSLSRLLSAQSTSRLGFVPTSPFSLSIDKIHYQLCTTSFDRLNFLFSRAKKKEKKRAR